MGVVCSQCSKFKSHECLVHNAKTDHEPLKQNSTLSKSSVKPKGLYSDLLRLYSVKEAKSATIESREKTQEEIHSLWYILKDHIIFKNLDKDNQVKMLEHIKHYKIGAKEIIFKEGDPGTSFYFVDKGKLEVISSTSVAVIGPGTGFGELALLDDRPRTSTIRTLEPCSLWVIDRKTFNKALRKINELNYEENTSFINSIPLFKSLSAYQKELIVSALVIENWKPGQTIIEEKESGNRLYVIKDGAVVCYEDKVEKRKMFKGDYFGEQALLYKSLRTATVKALDEVKTLSICSESLFKILGGKLEYILYRNSLLIAIDRSLVLKNLNPAQVQLMLACLKFVKYKTGSVVVPKGSKKCFKLYIILKGSIRGDQDDIGVFTCIGEKEISEKDESEYELDYTATSKTIVAEIILSEFESQLGGSITQITINNEATMILTSVKLLKGLPKDYIESLSKSLSLTTFSDKEIIFRQGLSGDSFYIIKKGTAKIYIDDEFARDIFKHDHFGERVILFDEPHSSTIIASGELECWVLHRKNFVEIISESIRNQLIARIEVENSKILLDELAPIRLLGSGIYGNTVLTMHKASRSLLALKSVSRETIHNLDIYNNLQVERKILAQLDHDMIVRLVRTFKDFNRVYFLLEFVQGVDLLRVLNELQNVKEDVAKFYVACLILCLEYLHDRSIVFRDLKPENIMVDPEGYPKLIGFNVAKIVSGRTYTTVGTPHYMAPEIILRNGYSLCADYWSLGVILYEIVMGVVPFGHDEHDPHQVYERILENRVEFKNYPYAHEQCRELIEQLLSANPSNRLCGSFEKLKYQGWFSNFNWNRLALKQSKPPYVPKVGSAEIEMKNKTVQEYVLALEDKQTVRARKTTIAEPEDWDAEF